MNHHRNNQDPDFALDAVLLHCLNHVSHTSDLIKKNIDRLKGLREAKGGAPPGTEDVPRDQVGVDVPRDRVGVARMTCHGTRWVWTCHGTGWVWHGGHATGPGGCGCATGPGGCGTDDVPRDQVGVDVPQDRVGVARRTCHGTRWV